MEGDGKALNFKKKDPLEDWNIIPEESHAYVLFSMFYGKYPESVETTIFCSSALQMNSIPCLTDDGCVQRKPASQ